MANQLLCKNCVNYTPRGECKMFKYVDLVTGNSHYQSAHKARYSDIMCTKDGTYFVPKKDDVTTHTIICSPEGGCCVVITNIKSYNQNTNSISYDAIVYDNSYDDGDLYRDPANDVY